MKFRYIAITIILIGLAVIVSGSIFILQSKSVVGPTSSFMYNNSEWTINGYIIIIAGVIISAIGVVLWWWRDSNKNAKKPY